MTTSAAAPRDATTAENSNVVADGNSRTDSTTDTGGQVVADAWIAEYLRHQDWHNVCTCRSCVAYRKVRTEATRLRERLVALRGVLAS